MIPKDTNISAFVTERRKTRKRKRRLEASREVAVGGSIEPRLGQPAPYQRPQTHRRKYHHRLIKMCPLINSLHCPRRALTGNRQPPHLSRGAILWGLSPLQRHLHSLQPSYSHISNPKLAPKSPSEHPIRGQISKRARNGLDLFRTLIIIQPSIPSHMSQPQCLQDRRR